MSFVHLHLHTEYSLLDGANKIKELAEAAKTRGMQSVAVSDHGNLFGAIDFYKTMKSKGIQPIIGLEAYLHDSDELGDKSTKQRFHLCLFAKNETGYKNLMRLSSLSYLEGFYYYPRINKKALEQYKEGLICTSACLQGEINWHLNTFTEKKRQLGAKGYDAAKRAAQWYKALFGDDFYMEIMRHGIEEQRLIDPLVIKLAKELEIKLIATNDTHYIARANADAQEAFMCISTGNQLDDPKRLKHSVKEFFLKTPEEMHDLFADIPEALDNTVEIANKCSGWELKLGNPTPPNLKFAHEIAANEGIELPEPGESSLENDKVLFSHLCRRKLPDRLKYIPESEHDAYRERLELEIDIINRMKFPGYMLIVWDFVREAKAQGIPVGPGRGSAAGSLVAFALEITNIDPIKYGLLFERFLNPERVSMPDIDMDFCQDRRGEIIDYVVGKYGRENVAQVITFGSLLAKGVLRDVARVMGVAYSEADKMAKLIPEELGITLKAAWEKEPKIRELVETDPTAKKVWDFAVQLEGLKRNAGTHAAGVVISNDPLWHKTPLYRPSGTQDVVTQYDGRFLEDVDLIKFDFLGLKTLTVIKNALDLVEKNHQKTIDFAAMGMDDPEVFKTVQSGHTLGLFQIESSGMQQLNAKMKPSTFEDLIAVLALYRPGPMESGMVDDFVNRKHGREAIVYMFPELEPILAATYGVIVYQEQVMQIVQRIGGFSLGGADLVRRAMGKKKKEEMDKVRAEFAEGAAKQGFDKQKAVELFDLIEKFAGYGFNKSHSAAYAMITYQTAWLKTYYPAEFMSALLTYDADNTDKVVVYINEIKRMGIPFLPPHVNRSEVKFEPRYVEDKPEILFGLGAIKGAGEAALRTIINARKERPFDDLPDFLARIDTQKVNKKVLESLIKAGALDDFGYTRRALMGGIEQIVQAAQNATQIRKEAASGLFGDDAEEMVSIRLEIANAPELALKERLAFEKESLGLYVSGHPLDSFREELDAVNYTLSSDLDDLGDGSEVLFIGKVEEIKEKFSKKGNKIGIVTVIDLMGTLEVMLFERQLAELENMDKERPIAFKAEISKDEQFTRMTVRRVLSLEDAKKEKVKKKLAEAPAAMPEKPAPAITLSLELGADETVLERLVDLIRKHPGRHPVSLVIRAKLQDVVIDTRLQAGESLREAARELGAVAA